MQTDEDVAAMATEYVPALHVEQTLRPDEVPYVPVEQLAQTEEDVAPTAME